MDMLQGLEKKLEFQPVQIWASENETLLAQQENVVVLDIQTKLFSSPVITSFFFLLLTGVAIQVLII